MSLKIYREMQRREPVIAQGLKHLEYSRLAKGDRIVMWYPSVNRDEDNFQDPYTFDITRNPNDHLAFGIGEHFCLGAGFARLEIKVIFQELLKRLPDIHATDEPERLNSNFVAGIKRLPVEFTPER